MRLFIFLLMTLSQFCFAAVQVALIRAYKPNGELIRLEPNGQFFHLALQIEDGRWLHSHPRKGVELVDRLEQISPHAVVLLHEQAPPVTMAQVRPHLGLPFDYTYRWENERATYCAKLVGKLLGIEPQLMDFSAEHWRFRGPEVSTGVGLSPDDIYSELKKKGYTEISATASCEGRLENSEIINQLRQVK